jgi:hypothetical protein
LRPRASLFSTVKWAVPTCYESRYLMVHRSDSLMAIDDVIGGSHASDGEPSAHGGPWSPGARPRQGYPRSQARSAARPPLTRPALLALRVLRAKGRRCRRRGLELRLAIREPDRDLGLFPQII